MTSAYCQFGTFGPTGTAGALAILTLIGSLVGLGRAAL